MSGGRIPPALVQCWGSVAAGPSSGLQVGLVPYCWLPAHEDKDTP